MGDPFYVDPYKGVHDYIQETYEAVKSNVSIAFKCPDCGIIEIVAVNDIQLPVAYYIPGGMHVWAHTSEVLCSSCMARRQKPEVQ